MGRMNEIEPLRIEGPVTLKVRYLFAERANNAVSAVAGAQPLDQNTVAIGYGSLEELRDNLGNYRNPELEICARDSGFTQTTGLLSRTGGEPYASRPYYPLDARRTARFG